MIHIGPLQLAIVCGFYDKRAATGIKGNKWTLWGIFKDGRETYKQEQVLNHMRTVLHIGTFSETWVQCRFFHKAVIKWNSITSGSLIPVILSIRSTQDNKWALWQSRKTRSELLSLEMLTHPSCPACSFQMSPCRAARCSNHSRLHHSQPAGIIAQLQYRVSFDLRLWTQTVCVWLYFFFCMSCMMCKQCSFQAHFLNNCMNCVFPTVNTIKSDSTCFLQQEFIYYFEKKNFTGQFFSSWKLTASFHMHLQVPQLEPFQNKQSFKTRSQQKHAAHSDGQTTTEG